MRKEFYNYEREFEKYLADKSLIEEYEASLKQYNDNYEVNMKNYQDELNQYKSHQRKIADIEQEITDMYKLISS